MILCLKISERKMERDKGVEEKKEGKGRKRGRDGREKEEGMKGDGERR